MLYLATASGPKARDAMRAGTIGQMRQPGAGNVHIPNVPWAADNGCFADDWQPGRWWTWLLAQPRAGCLFAVCPDVVGDAAATRRRWDAWAPDIRAAGYRAAYVAQDGSDTVPPPWGAFDVLFIGGTTGFKLGPVARELAARSPVPVHMGRVNSERRIRYAAAIGCATADGTYLTFGPHTNLPKLLAWQHRLNTEGTLW